MDHPSLPSTATAECDVLAPALDELPDGVIALDPSGRVVSVNVAFLRMVDRPRAAVMHRSIESIVSEEDMLRIVGFRAMLDGEPVLDSCIMFTASNGEPRPVIVCSGKTFDGRIVLTARASGNVQRELADTSRWAAVEQERAHALAAAHDALAAKNDALSAAQGELQSAYAKLQVEMQTRERLENELRLAQKLEAIGQLAAGIAHEINTPMQYIGDNVHFVTRAFRSVAEYLDVVDAAVETCSAEMRATVTATQKRLRIPFLIKESPKALAASEAGIEGVSRIVGAMKSFAHVDHGEMTSGDINRTLSDTLIVAQSEYKHVATVETDLGDLPPVACFVGKLNQVFLNLIVNAAHAIADSDRQDGGVIRVKTRAVGDFVEISIADNGCGIGEENKHRVFDQFFTTKAVGRGTGQGLSLSRQIVVEIHGGTLSLDSEVGVGTVFTVRLPIAPAVARAV
jgi:signal transduction histidine kinase